MDGGEHGRSDKKVTMEQTSKNIIEEIIEQIIISKDGVSGTDQEVTCELVVLDQPGEELKEVVDEVFNSQDVHIFSFFNKQLSNDMFHY